MCDAPKTFTLLKSHIFNNGELVPQGCIICGVDSLRITEPICTSFIRLAQCPECRNVFHRDCLRRAVASIQSCPMCRGTDGLANDWECSPSLETLVTDMIDPEYECSSTASSVSDQLNSASAHSRVTTRSQAKLATNDPNKHGMTLRSRMNILYENI